MWHPCHSAGQPGWLRGGARLTEHNTLWAAVVQNRLAVLPPSKLNIDAYVTQLSHFWVTFVYLPN